MSLLNPTEFLSRARHGHCGTTADRGDCTIGQMGSFPLNIGKVATVPTAQQMRRAAKTCLDACNACARCNYVSLSVTFKDCCVPRPLP